MRLTDVGRYVENEMSYRSTKIGRKFAHTTGNKMHQFQGQRSRSAGRLTLRPEVRHIVRRERLTNLKLGTLL